MCHGIINIKVSACDPPPIKLPTARFKIFVTKEMRWTNKMFAKLRGTYGKQAD